MEIQYKTLQELRRALNANELTATDIASQTSELINQAREINAVISSDAGVLLSSATEQTDDSLALCGMPILVKDNIDTVDYPTTGGTASLSSHQPTEDAGVIKKLKQAGAIIAGKANMHEIAFGITSNNGFTGAVRNPYEHNLIPGGSSGGSAAAVAAGIVPVSLGSDTGGSNRIPASLCGVCGFRPSTGRYPGDGLINLSLTRDTVGVFAHSVEDISLVDAALTEAYSLPGLELKSLRLAVPRHPFFEDLEKETADAMEIALNLISNAGAQLVEIDMPDIFPLNEKVSFPIALFETIRELDDYLARNNTGISLSQLTAEIKSPDVKHIMEAAQADMAVPEEIYLQALNEHRPELQKLYADFFSSNGFDAMLYPTTPLTARPVGHDETVELNGQQCPTFPSYVRNGDPSSNAGIPSLSIPAGIAANGLPVGLSVDGPVNDDINTLAIGAALSKVLPSIPHPK